MELFMKSQQKDDQPTEVVLSGAGEDLLFGLVLYDTKDEDSQIQKAVESLLEVNYPSSKLKIIICSYINEHKDPHHYINYTNILLSRFKHARLILNHPLENERDVDHNAFSLCKWANYLVKMNHDQVISKDFFKKVSKAVKGKNTIVQEGKMTALPHRLVSKNYLDFGDFDKMKKDLVDRSRKNNSFENV